MQSCSIFPHFNFFCLVILCCIDISPPQYFDALDLCVEHNVWVTEELAERFTLPKDEGARNQILEKVAECAYAQENYKLATKKFTQAGNKVSIRGLSFFFAVLCFPGAMYIKPHEEVETQGHE